MKKVLFVLLMVGVLASACVSRENPVSIIGSWKLTAFGSSDSLTPAVPDVEASLTFDKDGKVSGSGGCNSLGGDYEIKGEKITFGPIASTLMGCNEPRMTQEGTVHRVLTDTASFKIEGNTLTITNGDTVLVFELIAAE